MSQRRSSRHLRRSPAAQHRARRHRHWVLGRGASGLPPHLLRGITRPPRSSRLRLWLATLALIGVGLTASLVIAVVLLTVSSAAAVGTTVDQYRKMQAELPNAASIAAETFETTSIYDRNGVLLQQVDQREGGWRTFVPLEGISQYVIDATVAAEDATFWTHRGVEPMAVLRVVTINLGGSGTSGGSTITQQLVRWLYPEEVGQDLTLSRKWREALAAVALEQEFSKQDILTMYMNQIFYGQRSYGIEAAANTYFDKHASELTLAEAALLAGLPQAPSFYDPTVNFDMAKKRQQYVLKQMVKYGYISQEEADVAFREPLSPGTRNGAILHAPHFTTWVRDYVEARWPGAIYQNGFKITTSIDVELQEEAEAITRSMLANELAEYNRNNAAVVIMVPWSGEVLAMVGSANFNDPIIGGQVNYAIAPLQPGSSLKPFVYAAAFERGWNPATVVFDTTYREETGNPDNPIYEPRNYSGKHYGAVTVRTALANSFNIPAVKAFRFAGGELVEDVVRRVGYTAASLPEGWAYYGSSMALGSGEVLLLDHTNAYATLANGGRFVPVNPVLKIEDSQGNVLYDARTENPLDSATQAISAEHVYQLTSILTDDKTRELVFTADNLFADTQKSLDRPVAGKSGTTNSWKDIWTMGYTTDVAVGVWVGNTSADGRAPIELPAIDGIRGAGPIWARMMTMMHKTPRWARLLTGPDGKPIDEVFPRPDGIYEGEVCAATGNLPEDGFDTRRELLVRGEGPSIPCSEMSVYQQQELAFAVKDLERNKDVYAEGASDRVRRFAKAVGFGGGDLIESGEAPEIQPAGSGAAPAVPVAALASVIGWRRIGRSRSQNASCIRALRHAPGRW